MTDASTRAREVANEDRWATPEWLLQAAQNVDQALKHGLVACLAGWEQLALRGAARAIAQAHAAGRAEGLEEAAKLIESGWVRVSRDMTSYNGPEVPSLPTAIRARITTPAGGEASASPKAGDPMPEHLRWKGDGPAPRRWEVNVTIVYRSYEDYVDD